LFRKISDFRQLFENDQQATPIVENQELTETNVKPFSCFLAKENSRGQSVIRSKQMPDVRCQILENTVSDI
jgi:hypothetical protein